MQALGRVLADAGAGSPPWDDHWYGPRSGSPATATAGNVLGIPAFYAGVTMIGEDIGKTPFQMFEDLGEDGRKRASNHPLDELIGDQPNDDQDAITFWETMIGFAYLRGRGIAEILPGPRGPVDQLVPLHPDLIRPAPDSPAGLRRYLYRDPKRHGQERTILADQVFVLNGRLGLSVVDVLRENLGLALSAQRYQSFLFSRGARFQGILTHKTTVSDPVRAGLRKALDEFSIDGPRSGRPLLVEEGMTWQNVSFTNKDAQFLEQMTLGIRDVARALRIPPSKLADLADANYANIEQLSIDYVTDSLLGWCVRIEQATRRQLIIATGRFFARHNLDALLRGDMASRATAYSLAIMWGWMTRNEVRSKENMNRIAGLDEILRPINMAVGTNGQPIPGTAALSSGPVPPMVRGQLRLLASDAANRVIRREIAAVGKIADRTAGDDTALRRDVDAFYSEHVEHVASALHVTEQEARAYVARQRAEVLANRGLPSGEEWTIGRADYLTTLAMAQDALTPDAPKGAAA